MGNGRYTANSKKTKSVTWMPGWGLKMKGRMDSRKGKGVCDEYIRRLNKKLISMESIEVIAAENELFDFRKEAAVILTGFPEQKKRLSEIPDDEVGDCVESIRMNRKNAAKRSAIQAGLKNAVERLTVINEQIVNTNMVLDERINKMRSDSAEKIHAYIAGVRCGDLRDYKYDMTYTDDSAREIYRRKHEELDEKIRLIVDWKMRREAAA